MSLTVLLVDDDPDFLEQHRLLLERAGYHVRAATSEAEAVALLDEGAIDAAVLDLMLEHDDGGFVLAHRIKRRWADVPVVLVTNVTAETGMRFGGGKDGRWLKADAVLSKPIRIEQLTRELNRLLKG